MANHLPLEKKTMVLALLTEGQSIRATSRITGVDQNTIMSLLVKAGDKARDLHDSLMVNIKSRLIECDELWAFCGMKQKHVKAGNEDQYGDVYTFVALDSETKLVPCYRVEKRTARLTVSFMSELSTRVITRFQLSTDSFKPYADAVDMAFGTEIDYAQIHKEYEETADGEKRYSPAKIIRVTKKVMMGSPKNKHISTSYVERQNLTVRMQMRRFTRLTNAFSKKLRNHEAAVDLHFFHYNFMRIHRSLRITPAMEAKITNRLWTWEDLLTWKERRIAA